MIRLIVGFLIAFGAVGGVETSVTDAELAAACGVAAVGLMLMWAGVNTLTAREGETG